MPDYLPPADDDFTAWLKNYVSYLTTDPTAPPLTDAEKLALTTGQANWLRDDAAHTKAQNIADTAMQTKIDTRTAVEAVFRQQTGDFQNSTTVTDTQRAALQIPIYKTGRTPVAPVESHPVITRIDTSTRLRHRLFYVDSLTPSSTAKPEGAQFCEIRTQLGGTAPTDPEKMVPLAMEGRSPHRNDFDPGSEAQRAWYAGRWINTRGEPGPWGPIASAVVPG